jgi:hypothetical protein
MAILVNEIKEFDFNSLNYPILFGDKTTNRVFNLISFGDYRFKFGYQSENVNPKINEISKNIYSLGIDLNFAIIDFEKNKVILNLVLDYYFYEAKLHNGFIYVITELLIIKINQITFETIEKFALPDIFMEIIFKGDKMEIKCLNNEIVCYQS